MSSDETMPPQTGHGDLDEALARVMETGDDMPGQVEALRQAHESLQALLREG